MFCDNQSVVCMINKTTSSCKNCLVLIRKLVLHSLKNNVRVFAKYISSKNNRKADLLSRLRVATFLQENPTCDKTPTPTSSELWPVQQIWLK